LCVSTDINWAYQWWYARLLPPIKSLMMTATILEFKRPPSKEEIAKRLKEVKERLSLKERVERLKSSVDRIDKLMAELKR
jgi:hypothetical protein